MSSSGLRKLVRVFRGYTGVNRAQALNLGNLLVLVEVWLSRWAAAAKMALPSLPPLAFGSGWGFASSGADPPPPPVSGFSSAPSFKSAGEAGSVIRLARRRRCSCAAFVPCSPRTQ
ncbi:hypothetical protein MHYP_G00053410 [Metynnis hypsauchen]